MSSEAESALLGRMADFGLHPPSVVFDGKLHRFRTEGESGNHRSGAGWYRAFPDRRGACFGDWRVGVDEVWQDRVRRAGEEFDAAELRRQWEARRLELEAERELEQAEAAAEAARRWEAAEPALPDHPYLVAKGIGTEGLRQEGDHILIAMKDGEGRVISLQTVTPGGEKRFLKGGRVKGTRASVGGRGSKEVIYVAEGFATAATVHAATGAPVAAAFTAHNLAAVAGAMRKKYPESRVIVASDNDRWSSGPHGRNPGVLAARAAAHVSGTELAIPSFDTGCQDPSCPRSCGQPHPTDYNDMAALEGLDAVRRWLDPESAGAAVTWCSLDDPITTPSGPGIGPEADGAEPEPWPDRLDVPEMGPQESAPSEPGTIARKLPAPLGIAELMAVEEPEVEALVDGLIPTDANFLLAAYPKSYKTMLLLALAVALATGTPFLERFVVPKRRRVGLVLMEDAAIRVRRRLERILAGLGRTLPDIEDRLFLWFRPPLRLTDQTVVELGEYVAEVDLDFLAVDSWAYVASGDSNSADEVTPQLQALSVLRVRRPGLTVGLAHHAAKGRDREEGTALRLTDIIRNSGAFGAWYDVGMLLSRRDEASPVTVRMEMRDQQPPDPFAFTVADQEPAGPANNYRSGGWLRLSASDEAPQTLERRAAAEKLVPAVREFLQDHNGEWASKNQLRTGVRGRAQDIDGAVELLVQAGDVEARPSPGPGKPALCRYLVRPRPDLVRDEPSDHPSQPRPVPIGDGRGGGSALVSKGTSSRDEVVSDPTEFLGGAP